MSKQNLKEPTSQSNFSNLQSLYGNLNEKTKLINPDSSYNSSLDEKQQRTSVLSFHKKSQVIKEDPYHDSSYTKAKFINHNSKTDTEISVKGENSQESSSELSTNRIELKPVIDQMSPKSKKEAVESYHAFMSYHLNRRHECMSIVNLSR